MLMKTFAAKKSDLDNVLKSTKRIVRDTAMTIRNQTYALLISDWFVFGYTERGQTVQSALLLRLAL